MGHYKNLQSTSIIFPPESSVHVLLSPTALDSFSILPQQLKTLTLTVAGVVFLKDMEMFVEQHINRGAEMRIRIAKRFFDPTWTAALSRFEGPGALVLSPYDEPMRWEGPYPN